MGRLRCSSTSGVGFMGCPCGVTTSWLRLHVAQVLQRPCELAQNTPCGLGFLCFLSICFGCAVSSRGMFLPVVSGEIM